jgi:hypothetical protein
MPLQQLNMPLQDLQCHCRTYNAIAAAQHGIVMTHNAMVTQGKRISNPVDT